MHTAKINEMLDDFYKNKHLNCARITLRVLSEIFTCPLQEQVDLAAIGMNGGGRFRAQCGLVEGGLMFLGVFFSQRGLKDEEIVKVCFEFCQGFEQRFTSLSCRDLRPGGFQKQDPKDICRPLAEQTLAYTADYISNKL